MIFYYYCEGNACAMCIVRRSENNSVGCSSPYPFMWYWGLDSVLSGSACVCSLTSPVSLLYVLHLGQLTPTGVAHRKHLPHTPFFAHRDWYEVLSIILQDRKELLGLLENKFIEKQMPCTQLHTWASEPMPLASALRLVTNDGLLLAFSFGE